MAAFYCNSSIYEDGVKKAHDFSHGMIEPKKIRQPTADARAKQEAYDLSHG
jgi:hypothetical protein